MILEVNKLNPIKLDSEYFSFIDWYRNGATSGRANPNLEIGFDILWISKSRGNISSPGVHTINTLYLVIL
jgi:hypothetical protein